MDNPDKKRILVVDDERQIRKLLRVILEGAGHSVHEAETGALGLVEAAALLPDCVILDLGLPDMDGTVFLEKYREWSKTPVLVLSARHGEDDKVKALDLGAEDYLTKPFGAGELLARLRSVMRRNPQAGESPIIAFGEVEIDRSIRSVRRRGEEVHLTAKEYALLCLLATHRGKVVTHRQILREIWGPHSEDQTHYLRVHMAHLRKKIEATPDAPQHLLTDAGVGYRLVD